MKRKIISITSEYDELPIHATVTIPDDDPLAIIQIFPGMLESRFRYDDLGILLASYGYVTVCADYRGHGESFDGARPLGYMAENNGWIINLKDQQAFCEWIREKYRHLHYYVFAYGFGCLAAASLIKRYEYEVSGAALVSFPAYRAELPVWKTVCDIMKKHGSGKAPLRSFRKFYNDALREKSALKANSWLSKDEAAVEKYSADLLCSFDISCSMGVDLLFAMQDFYVNKDWHCLKRQLPIRLMSGENDRVSRADSGLKKVRERLAKIGYQNISTKTYPGLRSDLISGKGNDQVLEDLILWYNEQAMR